MRMRRQQDRGRKADREKREDDGKVG